jgi:hypothetical protein
MQTPYGEISDDDIYSLEYKLNWYLRYGNLPTATPRDTATARLDYGYQYERYIGYLYESDGYKVEYNGLRKGLDDGGIDLIARKHGQHLLIQCKRWEHAIGIDIISRLHGATARYIWELRKCSRAHTRITAVLVLSSTADDAAKALAEHLGIVIRENVRYQPYPAIKAKRLSPNIGYFLIPLYKGYDTMTLNPRRGDQYFASVRDALANAFYFRPYHKDLIAAHCKEEIT